MIRGSLRRRMAVASAVLAVIVGAAFALLLVAIVDLRRSSNREAHSGIVIANANRLERIVIDFETGGRAYMITRDPSFLQPWRAASREFPPQSRTLERLVRDNPAQERRARQIVAAIRSYLAEHSKPLIAAVGRHRLSDAEAVATVARGKRRVDAIRAQFDRFDGAERSLQQARSDAARASGRRAILDGSVALGGSILLVLLFALYLGRSIVGPIRGVGAAARRLKAGDLSARVENPGSDELGELADAFNEMAAALQESRDELESQNAELEVQASELEDQQERLVAAHADLAAEKERLTLLYEFAGRLAQETDSDELARTVLRALCEEVGADAGAIYVQAGDRPPRCAAVVGLGHDLVGAPLRAGEGVAGRALDERRLVQRSHDDGALSLATFSGGVRARHELGIPILYGANPIGVAVLARAGGDPFESEVLQSIGHLVDQAAVALARADAFAEAQRLARINRAVLESVSDGIVLVDPDGRTLLENSTKLRMVEELIPYGPGDTIWEKKRAVAEHTSDPAAYRAALDALAADPEREATDSYRLDSGRWVRRYATPVRDPAGALIGRLFVVREVTAEHEAERLARINGAVLDATRDGILLMGNDGSTGLMNRALEEMIDDLLPSTATEDDVFERAVAFAVHARDRDAYLAPLRAIEADPGYAGEDEFELLSGRWVKRYTTPVYDADGSVLGRLMVLRETTSERRAEQLKSDLVATVSHELRTPLAGVLGFAELLATRELDAESRGRYLNTIHGEAQRLTSLINNFLDLQRIEDGGFTLAIGPLDLGALLREEVELYTGQSAAHTVTLDLGEEPLVVAGDADRIAQVIGNLLSNAIKYSPAGGEVEVTSRPLDGMVRVTIRDLGLGIPAADQPNVFAKFFRVDSSDTREIGGTGLGLSLSQEIVEAHSGRIGFESVEGEGSTFWFELPLHVAGAGARRRALVVEDDEPAAQLLSEQLADSGCTVEIVSTGEAALASVRKNRPALVCLDMVLAGVLDGWQVLSELKRDPATANVPVIICTGGPGGRPRAAALGASGFLSKPFSRQQLLDAVERVLPGVRGSVLIVDDEASVRTLVRETLAGRGLEFTEAGDGVAALAEIARGRPDAIVLDLVMPNLDGFDVLERLDADPALRTIPVIVLTGHRLTAVEQMQLRARTVSLLEKSSYSGNELRTLIERALAQQPLDRLEEL